MPVTTLLEHGREALLLSVALALPIVGVAAGIGLLVAVFQAASQIQDPTIAHLPRLLGVVGILVVLGPWVGHSLCVFAEQMLASAGAQ